MQDIMFSLKGKHFWHTVYPRSVALLSIVNILWIYRTLLLWHTVLYLTMNENCKISQYVCQFGEKSFFLAKVVSTYFLFHFSDENYESENMHKSFDAWVNFKRLVFENFIITFSITVFNLEYPSSKVQ